MNGRKIPLVNEDDQSSPTVVLSAAQKLIKQERVFAVIEESGEFASAYRYLQQQDVPVLSAKSFDGAEWGDPAVSNMIDGHGSTSPAAPPPADLMKLAKTAGGTKLALFAYGASAADVLLVTSAQKAAEAADLPVVYVNKALTLPATGLPAIAVAAQKSGADTIFAPIADPDSAALYGALKAQGAKIKVPLISGVYGQQLLDNPASRVAYDGGTLSVGYNVTNAKALTDAVHKYTSYKGIPSLGVFFGWVAADLFIDGLQKAGNNPTRESFLAALHNEKAYTAGGLQAPVDLAQAKQGTYTIEGGGNCTFGVRLQNGAFSPIQGSPFCN